MPFLLGEKMIRILSIVSMLLLSSISMAFTLELTEEEFQEEVSAIMPLEKNQLFATLIFTNPVVALLETDNKIGITLDITVTTLVGVDGTGTARLSGDLRYDNKTAEFYVNDPILHELMIDDFSEDMTEIIKDLARATLKTILLIEPVYKLKDDDLKQQLAKSLLKSVKVENKKMILELSPF